MFWKKRKRRHQEITKRHASSSFSTRKKTPAKSSRQIKKRNFRNFVKNNAVLLWGILISLCVFGIVLLLSLFRIQTIQVSRKDFGIDAQKINIILNTYRGKSMLLTSENAIRTKLSRHFGELSEITIHRSFPSTLSLTLATYPPVLTWICEQTVRSLSSSGRMQEKTRSSVFFVNKKGIITAHKQEESADSLFLIYEKGECSSRKKTGQHILSQNMMEVILEQKQKLEEIIGIPIPRAGYYQEEEIHFFSEVNTAYWMDFETPLQEQIDKLKKALVLESSLKDPLDHVDLRIPHKIYYAPTSS